MDTPLGYRDTQTERLRARDLLRLLPERRSTLLEIGAGDGYHSSLLTGRFGRVVAVDLTPPARAVDRVTAIAADVTALPFADLSFDAVLCAEVLEHVPALEAAAREITRVARHDVLVGVPYRQDTRVGQLTCSSCGLVTPAFGHLHAFDESRLRSLFPAFQAETISLVGTRRERTNALSSWLLTLAGNPWGTYDRHSACVHCHAAATAPRHRSAGQRVLSRLAWSLDRLQHPFVKPTAAWIHVLFRRRQRA